MVASASNAYFEMLADLIASNSTSDAQITELIVEDVIALLTPITSQTLTAYTDFSTSLLCLPELEDKLGTHALDTIFSSLNYRLLASALASYLTDESTKASSESVQRRLWLLSRFIYARHQVLQVNGKVDIAQDPDYIRVVSVLLSSLADELIARLDIEDTIMETSNAETSRSVPRPLPSFVRTQIKSLVRQSSVSSLLTQTVAGGSDGEDTNHAKALATYALTLLRVFPRKADEIRFWLFLGSASSLPTDHTSRISPIRYFWQSARNTSIFTMIKRDQKQTLALLRPPSATSRMANKQPPSRSEDSWKQEWQVILLFLELYTFILKFMDDEEFLSGHASTLSTPEEPGQSWTKEGALPLSDVKDLTVFLKNLGFTLYWNASDLAESAPVPDENSIRSYFATQEPLKQESKAVSRRGSQEVAGMLGIAQDYLKGLITGLLRMIHERDSRRRFLPKDHWLMTSSVDMAGFIPAVVGEEEKRHLISEEEDDGEDDNDLEDEMLDTPGSFPPSRQFLVGTARVQQTRRLEILKRRQERTMRRRMLESIAPRLEILRNLPFFVPFDTRVQIFREFVHRDQLRRRNGFVDPDTWRMSVMHTAGFGPDGRPTGQEVIGRHHADIKRNATFESAFDQFYTLGDGLKEPIQISFIDQFGSVEAGIDGGGVTKEFLTSVTKEAFDPHGDLGLFTENDQHLLYPTPGSLEERKELLRQAEFREGSPDWREGIAELLRRYEFLGRIIGKCLYEGILVDVNFAGFFLLKWALTGGTTSASNESAYKPNLNDLRDLDEGLYQGLLQLKNYAGNVEDFSLHFSITDTFALPEVDTVRRTKNIDHDLIPNGSSIPVTNQNRPHYISLVTRHRLASQQYYQTKAFLQGLGQMISSSWLSMFNQHELQTLVSGDTSGEIDVEDLRAHTQYGGLYVIGDDGLEHPNIQMFWDVMRSFSHEDRRKVLKFVTSTPRAPLGGFSHLNPRFSIRDSGTSEGEVRLPSTSTCVNLLKLPRYRTKDQMKEKLKYSIESGAGFDLS